MRSYPYRLVNVFAETTFGGNPLCVFESGHDLSNVEMQALALQFNLSETTFIMPGETGPARVRIFTPSFEMPFAGHPTLGTAHVVRELFNAGDSLSLSMLAGVIPVSANGDVWTLTANAPTYRDLDRTHAELADMLGLAPADLLDGACWVNTGSDQLIVPLASVDAVRRAKPAPMKLAGIASETGRSMAYVFAANGDGRLLARFFFLKYDSVIEDPGTGSATANLGGWFLRRKKTLPISFDINQGETVSRPCRIGLSVDTERRIRVSGRVFEIGHGVVTLP